MLPIIVIILLPLLILGYFLGRRRKRIERRKKRVQQIHRLQRWMIQYQSEEPMFQLWKRSLSEKDSELLLELLEGYCTTLNWDLDWLLSSEIKKAPELQEALEVSISGYLETIFLSLQKDQDVQAYLSYLAFMEAPTAHKYRDLLKVLYGKLAQDGLIPLTQNSFRLLRWRRPTIKQQIAAIKYAFEQDPARPMQLLKEVLVEEGALKAAKVLQDMSVPQQAQQPVSSVLTRPIAPAVSEVEGATA
ncbi:MAG: hypothetical protein AAF702_06035 [Chloroflexota bacterium]